MRYLIALVALGLCACSDSNPVDPSVAQNTEIVNVDETDSTYNQEAVVDNVSTPAAVTSTPVKVSPVSEPGTTSEDDVLTGRDPTDHFTTREIGLISRAMAFNEICHGSTDTGSSCEDFDQAVDDLKKQNLCYGKQGEVQVEYRFHHCTKDSL